jgi:hypothetical protein
MWMYLGPSCPDDFFSVELDNAEINTWNREIIPHAKVRVFFLWRCSLVVFFSLVEKT